VDTKNLTIVFTDMKGFTPRTSGQSRSATMDMLRRHRELLLPVIENRGGKLIKTIGDAFLVTFESPTDAVLTGMELQETLRTHNATLAEPDRIEIRVAINTGEVTLEEGDIYGEAVNIAARIEGIAEANEIYFTEATYLAMNKSEVPSAEIGYRVLKGIPHKIKVYRVLREGESPPAAPAPEIVFDSGVALSPRPASVWRRAAAFGLDAVLVFLAVLVLTLGARSKIHKGQTEFRRAMAAEGFKAPGDIPAGHPLDAERQSLNRRRGKLKKAGGVLWQAIFILYSTLLLWKKGATPGKRLLKLRVVGSDGTPLGFKRAFLRCVLYYLSAAPLFLGFLWAFWDARRMAWHDKISDSVVVSA